MLLFQVDPRAGYDFKVRCGAMWLGAQELFDGYHAKKPVTQGDDHLVKYPWARGRRGAGGGGGREVTHGHPRGNGASKAIPDRKSTRMNTRHRQK